MARADVLSSVTAGLRARLELNATDRTKIEYIPMKIATCDLN